MWRRTLCATSSVIDFSRALRSSALRRPEAMAPPSRILMFTSWSEESTPAELSMASVFRRTPARAASMRPSWVMPRLAPSPMIWARISPPLTRMASLALSPTCRLVSPEPLM
ncbi:hypothetical protein D3C73_975740 [compost metagenome]